MTIPKTIASRYGIEPGQEVEWLPAGDSIRVVPEASRIKAADRRSRLALFDRATERQRAREQAAAAEVAQERGWTRDELYSRGLPD